MDDWFYIRKVLDGEPAAFAPLVEKYKTLAYNISLKLVRQPEDAEEITQDAFVKAYRSLKGFKGEAKFSTWLYRIVYNSSVSHLRKKQHMVIKDDGEKDILKIPDTGTDPENNEIMTKALKKAVDELPLKEQSIVTLYYYQESSIDDIAEITGLSVSNVKVKLFRARKKLYEQLQPVVNSEMLTG